MKRVLPEFTFDEQQLNNINALAEATSLTVTTASILYGRGIDDPEKVTNYLTAGKQHYISPFKMQGMREACDLIKRARDEDWVVAVYGDYDADGICAATIMRAALKNFGIDPVVFVPERKNGYGLSCEALDEIFDGYNPQLLITVDCGISNAAEVAYVQESGAEVIVTDHHELPDNIPDCICVNPKFNDGYPYDNLCGAGVAFKVGCALNGESFYSYADVAAIATVADSVPLTGENRDIVTEGLKIINKNPRKCYAGFLGKNGEAATSQTIAFSIAPKINAAGRMGDAYSALRLFTTEDDGEIYDLTVKLSAYNIERQKHCDELYLSAKQKLAQNGKIGRVIMLWDEHWNSGFVGIVAARLAEEYCRPALLFVKNGDCLKGSARSVEEVNIFEALKACSEYILEFGGHSQAAGVNVTEENFPALESALNDFIDKAYKDVLFVPTVHVSGEESGRLSARTAKELEKLEPFGVGNKRPLFSFSATECAVRPLKALSPHVNVKSGSAEFLYFSGIKQTAVLESAMPKQLIFEYNVSTFRGKEYIKGLVRDIVYSPESASKAADITSENNLLNAAYPAVNCKVTSVSHAEAQNIILGKGVYGTAFLVNNYKTLEKFSDVEKFGCELFAPSAKSFNSVLILSPRHDVDLSAYGSVVWLDNPEKITLAALEGREVYVCTEHDGLEDLQNVASSREVLLSVFRWVSLNFSKIAGASCEEAVRRSEYPFKRLDMLFALKVFEELSLISFEGGALSVYKGVKTDLAKSELYRFVNRGI